MTDGARLLDCVEDPTTPYNIPYQMMVMGSPVTYFLALDGCELIPLYAIRQFDLRFLRDADNAGYYRLKCQSEQSTRARLRRIVGRLQLKSVIGNRIQTCMLKNIGILGRRAPKCCLLSHRDMKVLLGAFGLHTVSQALEDAWNQTLNIARMYCSEIGGVLSAAHGGKASAEGTEAVGLLQATDPLGMPASIENVVGISLPQVISSSVEFTTGSSPPLSPKITQEFVEQAISEGLTLEVELQIHPASSTQDTQDMSLELNVHMGKPESCSSSESSESSEPPLLCSDTFAYVYNHGLVDYDTSPLSQSSPHPLKSDHA